MAVLQNGIYRTAKGLGLWRIFSQPVEPDGEQPLANISPGCPLNILTRDRILAYVRGDPSDIRTEADLVADGSFRAYGGDPCKIALDPGDSDKHWSLTEDDRPDGSDIKDTWEPARFGWVFPLARAYQLDQEAKYAQTFVRHFLEFERKNPPFRGSNWASGQEAALRLIALICGYQAFQSAITSDKEIARKFTLSCYHHARRIPQTLMYARSQNNNHLLSESAGTFTAGVFLPGCPEAQSWRREGWQLFHRTLQNQIDPSGEYIQHSTNYHRLMLHLALWMYRIGQISGEEFPSQSKEALASATGWLWARMEKSNGKAVNLGHHDGAHLLTIGNADISDYRPTIQAASLAFCGTRILPPGRWDELSEWLGLDTGSAEKDSPPLEYYLPDQYLKTTNSWGLLRSPEYETRPAHADLLHFDLWIDGTNVLMDAGTFRYSAKPPWRNALAGSSAHNTVTIDGQDQMIRHGRFLWLDWASGHRIKSQTRKSMQAAHDGFAKLGCEHQREVAIINRSTWKIIDKIVPCNQSTSKHGYQLRWLLPDGDLSIGNDGTTIQTEGLIIDVKINLLTPASSNRQFSVVRGGNCLCGNPRGSEILGWQSPTYGKLVTAISLVFDWESIPPTQVETVLQYTLMRKAAR